MLYQALCQLPGLRTSNIKTLKGGRGLNVSHHTMVRLLEDWQWENRLVDQSQIGGVHDALC
jgi:hypothetical protein